MNKTSRSGSGMNIQDHISESLESIFWVKILKFFYADLERGSRIRNLFDPGSRMEKIQIRYPGSKMFILDPALFVPLFLVMLL
jgi:hypothetical protein